VPADPRPGLAEEIDSEKVEEPAVFDRVIGAGAMHVQGLFFTRPRAVRGMRPVVLSTAHFQRLRACTWDELDLDEPERLIRSDLTLAGRSGFLRALLDIQVAAGQDDWSRMVLLGHGIGLSGTELAAAHVDALTWGRQTVASTPGN
jgi:hypothetical protein